MTTRQSLVETINMPRVHLKCIIQKYERIRRLTSILFYTLAAIQLIAGSLAVVAHAHEEDGLFGDSTTIKAEGIILSCTVEIIAGIIIIVPINATMVQSQHSIEILNEYYISKQTIPIKAIKAVLKTNTLCFKNPFDDSNCPNIAEIIEKKEKTPV